jgi:hypothetical protein
LVSVPEVAVTVTVYLPGGVPLTGACVVVLLHAGKNSSNDRTAHKMNIPTMRRRRSPIPTPSSVNPGTINQIA